MRTPPLVRVADDNAMNVDIMKTRLSADGYDVVTAADGAEALAVARSPIPDLVLLDVSRAAGTTAPSGPRPTSPPASALRPRAARFSGASACAATWKTWWRPSPCPR
jgi:CheY-like chemotaxis protein